MSDQSTLFTAPPAQSRSLAGQAVIGQMLTSPWFQGTWEVTQGWGATSFDGEPEGHGQPHWHAGVDVGLDCGTVIELPLAITGKARTFDNPGGYGTAMVILVDGGPGIVLGHLRQRLVEDGAVLQGGDQIAVSNSTGNSTGCHLHFETRPQDPKRPLGIAAYGTDVDPSSWLLYAVPDPAQAQLLAQRNPITGDISDAITGFARTVVASGGVLLGASMVMIGLLMTAWGLRGGTMHDLTGAAATEFLNREPKSEPAPPEAQPISPAAESRIRPDLQRQPAATPQPARAARRALPARALPPP